MSPPPPSYVDVLVIGAGPAGVMMGTALSHAGINVRVVDKRPAKVMAGQADGIQPRTIEVFQSYGLAQRLLERGNQMHSLAFYNPRRDGKGVERTSRVPDVTAPTARYRFEVTLHQGEIEAIFLDSMRAHGLEVERPCVPESIEISGDEKELQSRESYPVKVVLRHLVDATLDAAPNGMHTNAIDPSVESSGSTLETVYAKYVLGADGAHSWVRNALGISLDGEQTDHVWGVVDSVPVTDFPDIRNRTAIHSDNGSCMIIPREGDKVRLYVQITDGLQADDHGRIDRSAVTPERVMEIAKRSMRPYKLEFPDPPEWWTCYVIGQRVAKNFSVKDRAFIAGDACHTHSPKAGQGMNASMNDSHNLAWKLAHVLRGWASPDLLKTYELERRKYARDLINFDKKLADLFSGKAVSPGNAEGVTHQEFQGLLQSMGGFTSGIGIQYIPSLITDATSQSLAEGLVIGQRFVPQEIIRIADSRPFEIQDLLVSDTKWKVVFFVGDPKEVREYAVVTAVGEYLQEEKSFLRRFTPKGAAKDAVFTILTVSSTAKDDADYTDIHPGLRTHWSRAFTDDIAIDEKAGGTAYRVYGIDPASGAVVVCRPDGYVSFVCALEDVTKGRLEEYFGKFMIATKV
ncbi:hypothetical protein DACRYDRAFT_21209 [Dacryopinax primogenitus]|uniref:FAD binding domain-containing protein n=1 Tax=Dacryopinax primogenitus (strain DJM 731) TaxID=1858805 RepID=M5G506_DACPD|nr:uncharacterized protein DACRYDRAFT_21209 [Dacryopinax primogenitus]EJU03739.1 hypothetical protein DACRYDRAFT_21209 [Dacryopinax primogenitus]